jgi:MFS family permease
LNYKPAKTKPISLSDSPKNNKHQKEFGNYLGGLASWWIGLGLQIVLIPFVVTQQLHETADNLGIAQMCSLLPAFLFILHAGIMADRNDCRTIILRLHLLAIIPSFAIAFLIYSNHLYFEMLLVYALAMGTLSAYNIPSRDALLHRLAQGELQKEVSKAMTIQFMAQMVGFLFAGLASFVGLVPLFILQGITMISGAIFMSRIESNPPHSKESNLKASKWQLLKEGFQVVGANAPMRLVSILNILVGLVFMGSLMVAVPIIVRDVYGGTSTKLSFSIMAFYFGVIVGSLILGQIKRIENIGTTICSMMALGAGTMLLMTFHLPFASFLGLVAIWGIAVGFVFSLGRTVIQENATRNQQARALSIYQIGITGGGPIGALIIGFLTHHQGALEVLYIPALFLLVVLLLASMFTKLLKIKSDVLD